MAAWLTSATRSFLRRPGSASSSARVTIWSVTRAALGDHPNVGDIRGEGMLCAVEFVRDRTDRVFFEASDQDGPRMNILFIMYDQLRFDYLSCAGHPHLHTPNFDRVAAQADATRGTTCDALVEAIDLAATFGETAGGRVPDHIIEGRSLLPWLWGEVPDWRDFAIREYDFSSTPQCVALGFEPREARLFMVFDGRFKLIHAEGGFRPMLFDLETDPEEFHDLAKADAHQAEIDRLYGCLAQWGRRLAQRVTKSDDDITQARGKSGRKGILPFLFDGSEVPEEWTAKMRGPAPARYSGDDG